MAQQYSFGALARSFITASVCLPLLASFGACQSDSDDDSTDEADPIEGTRGAGAASPAPVTVAPRADGAAAVATGGSNGGAEPAAVGSASAEAPAPAASEGPASANAGAPVDPDSVAASAGLTFEACTTTEGSYGGNCDIIYVAVQQASPSRCVQLTIDNCGSYDSRGLPVDVPTSWRLASGSIGSNADECDLGVFDPEKAAVVGASGTISWNELTLDPTELAIELTLEPSSSARDTTSVRIATPEPFDPVGCEP